jgi:molecular chaperone GrpE
MNKTKDPNLQEEFRDDAEPESSESVDDFLKQLEAREKDLHISADLAIEVEDSEFESFELPETAAEPPPSQKAAAVSAAKPSTVTEQRLKTELAALKNHVSDLKSERLRLVERARQSMKEFDNFKHRMERERRDTFVNQVFNLANSMLPVLDNLDRALDFAGELQEEKSGEFKQFFEGIMLVNQQIVEVLAGMGVQPIATVGEQFDPNFHEAVAIEHADHLPQNTICEELLRGYRIGDKIIRHSMVKVVGEPAAAREPSAEIAESDDEIQHVEPRPVKDEPLPAMDEEVEELIASSYANPADEEPGK